MSIALQQHEAHAILAFWRIKIFLLIGNSPP